MGLVSLKEQTKIQAMATVFYCLVHKGGKPQPIATTRKSLLKEFTSIFHSTPASDVGGLPMYPANPHELGEEWLSKVYKHDAPALINIPHGWAHLDTKTWCI